MPFAEYIPHWAKFLKIGPLVNLGNIYQAASPQNNHSLLQWRDKNIALGICFEEYFDNWYFLRKQPIAMYVFLNSESLFNKWGKHFLKNTAASKSRQWNTPSFKKDFCGVFWFLFAKEEKICKKKIIYSYFFFAQFFFSLQKALIILF